MSKLKSRKRLTTIVIAFMLVFVVGAAFAFAAGQLTIGGTVNLDPLDLYIVWDDGNEEDATGAAVGRATGVVTTQYAYIPGPGASPGTFSPLTATGPQAAVSVNSAVVEDRATPGPNTENQHIEWNIEFRAPGRAVLDAVAFNRSTTFDGNITRVTVAGDFLDVMPTATSVAITDGTPATAEWSDIGLTMTVADAGLLGVIPATENSGAVIVTVDWDGTVPATWDTDADNPALTFTITWDYEVDS